MTNPRFTNHLIQESSLYLRQHAHNPVDWYPWSDEPLTRSKNENKLIFLSIGYSSCHWCHVMERESFEDEHVAAFLNKHFICIKVDREERPDIDAIYMESVQMMTGGGGWPLNVWLTPDLTPVYGGTYFPPESSHQRPGFLHVLQKLVELQENDPKKVSDRAREMAEALKQDIYAHIEPGHLSLTLLKESVSTCEKHFDETNGGFSDSPKFPSAMTIEFLMRFNKLTGDEKALEMALFSLRKLCLGGIYDQAGGGFHRYATDSKWLIPHFEKMLYDNALLLSALTDAWQITADPLFKETIFQTIGFIKREMMSAEGGFYAALDADSEGEEGVFYVWDFDTLQKLIPEADFPVFSAYYGIYPGGNWEGKIILNRSHSCLDFAVLSQYNHDDLLRKIKEWHQILLQARQDRVRPALDTKVIASWNGMMLKSLCKVWMVFRDQEILTLVQKNARFMRDNLLKGGELYRIENQGDVKIPAFCDDYALVAEAFCWVFQVTGEDYWLDDAVALTERMNEDFFIPEHHAFAYTKENQGDVIVRKKDSFDNEIPSANSAAVATLYRVGRLTGNQAYLQQSVKCMEALESIMGKHSLSLGYLLQVVTENMSHHRGEIVLLGEENELYLELLENKYLPFYITVCGEGSQEFRYETFWGKFAPQLGTRAYVCHDFVCEIPVTEPDQFLLRLKQLPESR